MIVIPAIDMTDGCCVRLFQGQFDRQTRYSDDPSSVAERFGSMGFTRIHLVDLDGARSGKQENRHLVQQIAKSTTLSVQLGGGIRHIETVRSWLDAGVSRCVIGSIAVTEPARVKDWLSEFGPGNIVLAFDVRLDNSGTPFVATHGWTRATSVTLWQSLDDFGSVGLRHVLCTDISRDGAMSGPNLELYSEFVKRYPDIELQASGGVRNLRDLEYLRGLGAAAAITGRALLDGQISREEIASFQRGE